MDEIRIRKSAAPWGVMFEADAVLGVVGSGGETPYIDCADMEGLDPAEARAFAQRIIAVADAVEAELKEKS